MMGGDSIAAGVAEFEALGNGPVGQRYRQFVLEYVADPKHSATRAYLKAFKTDNYNSASALGSKLLKNIKISAAIGAIQNKIRETALDRMLDKLEAIIHTDLPDVMEWNGDGKVRLVPSGKLSAAARAALAQIQEMREERQPRLTGYENAEEAALTIIRNTVRLHDPLKAMEIYAKLAGIGGAERVEVSGLSDRLERALAAGAKFGVAGAEGAGANA
jgi:hypothetical protein